MKKSLLPLALLVCLVASANAVPNQGARSRVVGGWQDVTFSLQDLDPSDAFAPTVAAVDYIHCFGTYLVCWRPAGLPPPPDTRLPVNFQAQDGTGFPATQPLEHTTWSDTLVFSLSPNTRLTITGSIYVDSSGPVYQVETSPPYLLDVAVASGKVVARLGSTEIEAVSSSAGRDEGSFEISLQSPPQGTLMNSLTLEAVLTSGTNIVFPNPVPEPATWALLWTGLIGVGCAARRRARA